MTYEEALQIRDDALIAHIEYGKKRLEHQDQRINELVQERTFIAQQLEAMEQAQYVLAQAPPATEPDAEPDIPDEVAIPEE